MKIKTYIIDAFTDQPFKGNPAGVCLLEAPLDDATMQSVAAEMNLSETAFVLPMAGRNHDYTIRYFTPTVEIPLCGHATLAAAKVILQEVGHPEVMFTTHHGLTLSAQADDAFIRMAFPWYDTVPYTPPPDLLQAIGLTQYTHSGFNHDLKMLIVEVEDLETLKQITPDFPRLTASISVLNNLVITARSTDPAYDFYSRCFCPWIGIPEDPVTGASHTILAKYWMDKLHKTNLTAYQASARGGFMHLAVYDDHRLAIRSKAQIVLAGEMTVS